MPHLIVTGPESTGKTTLARQLAAHFDGVFIPEYTRGYLEAVGRLAQTSDFAHFAAAEANLVQAAHEQLARRASPSGSGGVIVQDTSAEVLKLWYEDKFGDCPRDIEAKLREDRADVYLVCRPDLPWEYDRLREDPHRRGELFTKLRDILDKYGKSAVEVRGIDDQRLADVLLSLRAMGIAVS